MKKLLSFMVAFSILSFGLVAHAEVANEATPVTTSASVSTEEAEGNIFFGKMGDKELSWKESMSKGKIGYGHGFRTAESPFQVLWFIGWLFTIGYLGLTFWKGVLALIIWPYFVGKHFSKKD